VSGRREAWVRAIWRGEHPVARVAGTALLPAAAMYGAAVALRNRLYDKDWLTSARVPARVIGVGNLSVGGSGKTPTVLWLAEALQARGRRVAIVARGYGKRRRGVVVVGEAGMALVTAAEGGDEAVMLAGRFSGPVLTAERRADAARRACERYGVDTIVLDDGFQHRALARDADLVVLTEDPHRARLLPAGPLREGAAALRRARAVLLMEGVAPSLPASVPAFRARTVPVAVVRDGVAEDVRMLRGRQVLAVAGIARPERFFALLATLGAEVRHALAFADHHVYTAADGMQIAAGAGDATVVTTEKDAVKLTQLPGLPPLAVLRIEVRVEDGARLLEVLEA